MSKLPEFTQVLFLDASNIVYVLTPIGQAIDAFPCLHDHPMPSGLEHCLSIFFLLLCSSAGDLEENMTTEHSSAIGD